MRKKFDIESMKAYFREGHTAREVAERFGASREYVKQICRGIRPGNQYTSGLFDREANAIRHINERVPLFEYAGNFTGIDGYVDLKCKACGTIVRKSFVCVKQGTATCKVCSDKEKELVKAKRKRQAETNRIEQYRQRMLSKSYVQTEMKQCPGCGMLFTGGNVYCSISCRKKVLNARGKDKRIRRVSSVVIDKNITLESLFERSKGKCALCGGQCDYTDYHYKGNVFIAGNQYPSIDHIVPLSKGGLHSWDNVQLAHRICNTKKSNDISSPVA